MTTLQKTHANFVDHVVETMASLGPVVAKPMFGGWGLYHAGVFFALIIEDALYLKVDEENRAEFLRHGLSAFVYVTKDGDRIQMSYHQAPADALESPALMLPWARSAYAAAVRSRARKPVRKKTKA
jgi:DNA transformation protein